MPASFGHHGIDVLIRKLESIGTLSEEERQAGSRRVFRRPFGLAQAAKAWTSAWA